MANKEKLGHPARRGHRAIPALVYKGCRAYRCSLKRQKESLVKTVYPAHKGCRVPQALWVLKALRACLFFLRQPKVTPEI